MHRAQRFGQLAKRFSSVQAVGKPQDNQPATFSVLGNGLRVATCNENAPAARVVLLVNTGSRDDTPSTIGLTHCLQNCAGLTSAKNTAFLTTQLLSSLGADLEVTAGRDHIIYSMGCYDTAAKELVLDVLTPSLLGAQFPWWEVEDMAVNRMRYQKALAESDPMYVLMENAHRAAFRGSFSGPVLSPSYMIGKHTKEMLTSRFESAFTLDNMVLAASGISHGALAGIGSNIEGIKSSDSLISRNKPEFLASEIHVDQPSKLSYAALIFEGYALDDKDAITLSVLQQAMGTTSSIKRGSGFANGIVNTAIEGSVPGSPFSTSAFSVNYSDCGLFGVVLTAPQNTIGDIIRATSNFCAKIANEGINEAALISGKQRLKSRIFMEAESGNSVADVAVQASQLGAVATPEKIASIIDSVSSSNVLAVAKRVLGGKKSMTTLGQGFKGPYLQDL